MANKCSVNVKRQHGAPVRSVKVSTEVSGGISCIGGRSFYTDGSGRVFLEWSSGCYLKKVYVDGRGYSVDFKDGGSYTITIN